jgi:hypothetical protein
MQSTTEDTPSTEDFGLIVGGYRVKFTNWNEGRNEKFFATWVDAQNYLLKFKAYGYKGAIDTIYLNVKAVN